MEDNNPHFEIDNEEDVDDFYEPPIIQPVDINGNIVKENNPRSVDELNVGSEPVDIAKLKLISNLNKAKLVSQRADQFRPYEKTGNNQTGVIGEESFKKELLSANFDIILKEHNPIKLPVSNLSMTGMTNENK